MKTTIRAHARERLDARLAPLKPGNRFTPPPRGWLRAVRDAIGMTGAQLAARLKMRPQSLVDLEKSEINGTIQLKTLQRAAEALGCTLVYALVPKTSLEEAVRVRARQVALRDLRRVSHTMKLENQAVDDGDLEDRIEAYIRDALKDRDLWEQR